MFTSMRRFPGFILAVTALLGLGTPKGQAQLPMNPYVNPMAAQAMFPYNAAVLQTQGLLHSPLAWGGTFTGMGVPGGFGLRGGFYGAGLGFSGLGYGGLGYGGLGYGGYGAAGYGLIGTALTSATAGYGFGYGYGLGMGTQWMMNPYQGYLQGAADVTRADAEYYRTIQQARSLRQQAIRSSLETRRAMIEEAEWEREHMPDPEKIRQQEMERELSRARVRPPLTDIWTARSLNSLLRHLVQQQGNGAKGPRVPLPEEVAKHINTRVGDTRGNLGLIRDNSKLEWPELLTRGEFKKDRERINSLMREAYRNLDSGQAPDDSTLNDLKDTYGTLQKTLDANVNRYTPDLSIEAQRYLDNVRAAITALKDPNVVRHFKSNAVTDARDVAQLVRIMREQGLQFAEATPKDEAAYLALYHALASFDAGMQVASNGSSGNPENRENK